jgi:hypothetical protein
VLVKCGVKPDQQKVPGKILKNRKQYKIYFNTTVIVLRYPDSDDFFINCVFLSFGLKGLSQKPLQFSFLTIPLEIAGIIFACKFWIRKILRVSYFLFLAWSNPLLATPSDDWLR